MGQSRDIAAPPSSNLAACSWLVNALREGRSVVVCRLQRVGETSLVKEALDRELKPNGAPIRDIRIDMYEL